MTEAWFLKLKEYDSLLKMRNSHLQLVKEQEERMTKLKGQQEEGGVRTETLRKQLNTLQDQMHEIERKLKTAQEQQNRLKDIGEDESKILTYQQQIEELETEGLNLLSDIEEKENSLKDAKSFISGIRKTIEEIAQEVDEIINKEEQEIKNLELRLSLIEEELPSQFRDLLKKTLARKLAMGPFTRVEAGSCYMCRFKISRLDESEIDMQRQLKVCPQCSRIFLPYGT